jgi:lysophospholipase L1-like esterase
MKIVFTLLIVLFCTAVVAQNSKPPFWQDILKFKVQDSLRKPPVHPVLLVGSSSFTKWTDVQNYFPGYTILNRGFGGSTLPDLIRYEKDVIFRYHPKQIVIYCGDNDVASSDTITGETVFKRFVQLFADIRKEYSNVPVAFVSIKPSPSRWHLKDKDIAANNLIKDFLKKQKHASFINVWDAMLGADGKPNQEIFIEDNLHMNTKGYAIWQKIIQPYLIK